MLNVKVNQKIDYMKFNFEEFELPKDAFVEEELSVNEIVDQLSQCEIVSSSMVGFDGSQPVEYDLFINLINKASSDELIELTDHDSVVVNGYSFWGLVIRKDPSVFEILKTHINDDRLVDHMSGCIVDRYTMRDYYLSFFRLFNYVKDDYRYEDFYVLTLDQEKELSLLRPKLNTQGYRFCLPSV